MTRTLLLLCLATGLAFAQEESQPIDLEARRQSVVTLKQHLAMREKRLAEVAAPIFHITLPFQPFCGAHGADGRAGS